VHLSLFYAKNIVKEVTFIAIVLSEFILQIVKIAQSGEKVGIELIPTTYHMIGILEMFMLFIFILIMFFTGELVWKERSLKFSQIHDSLPISNFTNLVSKFIGLILVFALLLLTLILFGIAIQTFKGYYNYEIGLYFKTLYSETFFMIILYSLLAFFIQVVVNHKFLGYTIVVILFIVVDLVSDLGWEHSLLQFAAQNLGIYSDMNKYGHFVQPFLWRSTYWFALTGVLFVVAILFNIRGKDTSMKFRLKNGKLRLSKPIFLSIISLVFLFSFSGCYIYYNTNLVNQYVDSDDLKAYKADFEKTLKQYEYINQPQITDVNVKVEIYPDVRNFSAVGYYYIKNKSNKAISDIHIQIKQIPNLSCELIQFNRKTKLINDFEQFGYFIYRFNEALQAGDSIKMDFKVLFETNGFVDANSNKRIIYNGTFFNNNYFPAIGYDPGFELIADDDRKDYGLKPKERMLDRTDSRGIKSSSLGNNNGLINFEIVIGTSHDQLAIAPGYIQKEWKENGRNYFHYKMDKPIHNFYSIVSADYQVVKDKWKDVNLEIYYHKGHEYNLENMMGAMKKSLDYYTQVFGPYQYRQLRIMEFPRYSEFAQSFANTIPFSEGMGFILNLKDDDFDYPFYVTAHEVAHQWWGHQVYEANAKGAGMLGESITQYSALMALKKNYPEEQMQKFLSYELDKYLRGRAREIKTEMPLVKCENQDYIHYRKGSLAFYALQDYISEDSVNIALRRYLNNWKYREDLYPTTIDFMKYINDVTPDSLKYILTDMFETITIYENKAISANCTKAENKYQLELIINTQKFRADSLGNESLIPVNDWIDIGVYAMAENGKEKLIYLKKHQITDKTKTIRLKLDKEPVKAGIDPVNKLIDRHPGDNVVEVSSSSDLVIIK